MRAIRIISLLVIGAGAATIAAAAARPSVASAVAQAAQTQQQDIAYIGNGRLLSNIVKVGNTLYLSGVLGTSGERGITPETKAAMEAIKSTARGQRLAHGRHRQVHRIPRRLRRVGRDERSLPLVLHEASAGAVSDRGGGNVGERASRESSAPL